MSVPRLLFVLLPVAICSTPLAAQSAPQKDFLSVLSQTTLLDRASPSLYVDQYRLPVSPSLEFNFSNSAPGAIRTDQYQLIPRWPRQFKIQVRPDGQKSETCYSIRGYRVERDDPESDSTRPAGYSTCQPADQFSVKNADSPESELP